LLRFGGQKSDILAVIVNSVKTQDCVHENTPPQVTNIQVLRQRCQLYKGRDWLPRVWFTWHSASVAICSSVRFVTMCQMAKNTKEDAPLNRCLDCYAFFIISIN